MKTCHGMQEVSQRHNSSGHMAPLGFTGERYISHQARRFGKDSNPGRQDRSRLNQLSHPAPRKESTLTR
ncbi:hypothetical protein E2C01_065743 [Portunus trituberculatus]|uniref:Uncharacterized protein n=1 Tax=Portunus trituberculatus TaxID=210409 RepID=A0A5B7HP89_PORTR|nr:hypothetical protein [Portunus trituberculatus]